MWPVINWMIDPNVIRPRLRRSGRDMTFGIHTFVWTASGSPFLFLMLCHLAFHMSWLLRLCVRILWSLRLPLVYRWVRSLGFISMSRILIESLFRSRCLGSMFVCKFRVCLISLVTSFIILHFCGCSLYICLFVFLFSISHSLMKSLSFVLVIIVLIVVYLLKSANIRVSKFCSSSSVIVLIVSMACFAVWNLMFSFPISFLKIVSFVSICFSSRP